MKQTFGKLGIDRKVIFKLVQIEFRVWLENLNETDFWKTWA